MVSSKSLLKASTALIGAVVITGSPVSAQNVDQRASSGAASQAPSAAEADGGIAEIIVTANKREQSINKVGLTITALSGDELAKRGITTQSDLAKSVPGLSFSGTEFSTPVFTLRGVGFYDSSLGGYPTTSAYIDEVPLPFPAMTSHVALDLARVEVLKGPQGTLFGQNSTGGALNFISAKPTDTLAMGLDLSAGRFGLTDVTSFISGPVTDTVRMRLSGELMHRGDWQRSFTRNDQIGEKKFYNVRLLTEWRPSDSIKFAVNLTTWRDQSDPQVGQLIAIFPQVPGSGGTFLDPRLRTYPFTPNDPRAADWSQNWRPRGDRKFWHASLRGDMNLSDDITLTAISAYSKYKVSQVIDNDGTSLEDFQQQNRGAIKTFTQELRIAGGERTGFRWVVGGNFEASHTREANPITYAESTTGIAFGFGRSTGQTIQRMRNYAGFANAEYDVLSNLTFKVGARYTQANRRASQCSFNTVDGEIYNTFTGLGQLFNPNIVVQPLRAFQCLTLNANNNLLPFYTPFVDSLNQHNISWRAGLDWKAAPGVLLYANVSKGFKGGSYPVTAAATSVSYQPVVQESVLDYEAGFKTQLWDRRVSLNGAIFYYDYRNKQLLTKVVDQVFGIIPTLANIPKSRVKGAEIELTAAPVEGLTFSAGLNYLDGKITRYTGTNAGGIADNFAGTDIPFTSKWQYVVSADYKLPAMGSIRPFAGATYSGRSKTISIVGGARGAVATPGYRGKVAIADTYNIAGYATLDLRAGVETADGTLRAFIWGKNITNKYYWQNVVASFDTVTRYAGEPATYGITLSYRYR